ncbi:hypothetical protein RHS03_07980, partial [Rhizoctonia solani]
MQSFTSFVSRRVASNQVVVDPLSAGGNSQSSKRYQFSVVKYRYRAFMDGIVWGPERPIETPDIIAPRPRPNSYISSLAAATLLGLSQTQRIPPLVQAADTSLETVLIARRTSQFPPAAQPSQSTEFRESASLELPPPLLGISASDTRYGNYSGQPFLSVNIDSSALDLDPGRPGDTSDPSVLVSIIDSETTSSPLDPNHNRVTFVLPGGEPERTSLPLIGSSAETRLGPPPIHSSSKMSMRPPGRTGSTSSSLLPNRKLLYSMPNRSASSLLTTSTYTTAPTGASPPLSLRSLPRCDSPGPLPEIYRRLRRHSFQSSSLRESMAFSDFAHESNEIEDILEEKPITGKSPLVYTVAQSSSSSRKLLIIGNSYKECDQVKRMFSIQTLDGVHEDRDQLAQVFKERSYSIETLVEESFDKQSALSRVARFLGDAKSGDVRAIVFTGHGYPHDDGTTSLIPPKCPKKTDAIPCTEWDQNIRNHARPGVIVLSIMAHCYSEQVMKQNLDQRQWETLAPTDEIKDGPTYLTFAASKGSAYESWVTRNLEPTPNRTNDHFIHALASSIRLIDVATSTWSDFFREFDKYFQQARSCASWQDRPALSIASVPKWRESHDQTPSFTASRLVGLQMVF